MEGFRTIKASDMQGNVFQKIGQQWMLVTAGSPSDYNTMTASWGTMGILWGKPVAFCFVRPQRYTYQFMEKNEFFTLSFLPENYREALNICGTKSGREIDKAKETGLTVIDVEGTAAFAQAELILLCRKAYSQDIEKSRFILTELDKQCYPQEDYHRMYVGEIVSVYSK